MCPTVLPTATPRKESDEGMVGTGSCRGHLGHQARGLLLLHWRLGRHRAAGLGAAGWLAHMLGQTYAGVVRWGACGWERADGRAELREVEEEDERERRAISKFCGNRHLSISLFSLPLLEPRGS